MKWTLLDLVTQSNGAILFTFNTYIFKKNIIIAEQDTLSINSTDVLVFDCSTSVIRLTIEGNLNAALGCSSIIATQPIYARIDLEKYRKYPGVIYDDIGIRRRATPQISSSAISHIDIRPTTIIATTSILCGAITDATTGNPIPARVCIRKSDGEYVCDTDKSGTFVNYVNLPGFWTNNGSFECTVPAGTTDITISQGYEYVPYHETVTIATNEIRTVNVSLTPIYNMNSAGWYAGDAHNHVSHGEKYYNTDIPFAAKIACGQGYDWFWAGKGWSSATFFPSMNCYLDTTSPAQLDAITQQVCTTDFLCQWGQEEPKDFMGHMVTLGITDWEALHYNPPYSVMISYPHFELVKEIQDQGGIAMYTHPLREYATLTDPINYPGETFPQNVAREFPLDILIVPQFNPVIDLLTDYPNASCTPGFWFYLLNQGYRIACAAFTDTVFDRGDCTIGHNMTYVYVDNTCKMPNGSLTASVILNSFRHGKTVGTSGPLVLFSIDSHLPGETISIDSSTYHAQARIQSFCVNRLGYYLKTIEVVRNGETIHSFNLDGLELQSFETTLNFSENTQSWYLVRVTGTNHTQMAYTSPIYFAVGSYIEPPPFNAQITGTIFDQRSTPVQGTVEILNFGKVIQTFTALGGHFAVTVPATCRFRVSYGGATVTKSIFLGDKPLYDKIVRCRANDIANPAFYSELIDLLGGVQLKFQLPIELNDISKTWEMYQ